MRLLNTLILLGTFAISNGTSADVIVAIPQSDYMDSMAVATHIAIVAAATTGKPVVAEEFVQENGSLIKTDRAAEAKPIQVSETSTSEGWFRFRGLTFETGNQVIEDGPPVDGFESVFPGPAFYLVGGAEVSMLNDRTRAMGQVGLAGFGGSIAVLPLKILSGNLRNSKLQPTVAYRYFKYTQPGVTGSREDGQLWKRRTKGLAYGVNYALTKNVEVYGNVGKQNWENEYIVNAEPWIDRPASTRTEDTKKVTFAVGVSVTIR